MKKSRSPDEKYRFWYYSPTDGFWFFLTGEDRDSYAKEDMFGFEEDDGWLSDVRSCFGGEVTHVATEVGIKYRDDANEEENFPEGFDYTCDFELRPILEEALK